MQNIKLLGGTAPTVSMQLADATRLLNEATKAGHATLLRDWLVANDMGKDPQAHMLRSDIILKLAVETLAGPMAYLQTCRASLAMRRQGEAAGAFSQGKQENNWLRRLTKQEEQLPGTKAVSLTRWWQGSAAKRSALTNTGLHSLSATMSSARGQATRRKQVPPW